MLKLSRLGAKEKLSAENRVEPKENKDQKPKKREEKFGRKT